MESVYSSDTSTTRYYVQLETTGKCQKIVLNSLVWTEDVHAEGNTRYAHSFKEVSTETSTIGNFECRHRMRESPRLCRKESNRGIYRRQTQSRQASVASFVSTNCYYSNGGLIGSPSCVVIRGPEKKKQEKSASAPKRITLH
jgi:hypothetical protein